MCASNLAVFTVGHSTHSIDEFINLLHQHEISAIADVRSNPYSRFTPQFNREMLEKELKHHEIHYVFIGRELGARPDDPSCYEKGHVSFSRLANTSLFKKGIDRVIAGAQKFRIALMCAEKEPLECHRTILVSHALVAKGILVSHILADGKLERYEDSIPRLFRLTKTPSEDLFKTSEELIEEAFARQAERIAFSEDHPNQDGTGESL